MNDSAPSSVETVGAQFARLKDAWRAQREPLPVRERLALLDRLLAWVKAHQGDVAAAVSADFGHRSPHESKLAETLMVVLEIQHTRAHLKSWTRPEPRATHWGFLPASSRVIRQPRGVVGVISPWNYPFQLAVGPMSSALAAGNRVLLKPSEMTPRTSDLIAAMCHELFPKDLVDVVLGGADVGAAFTSLPFDSIFFTGSPSVAKHVMRAASANLTPVTLELGGRSPAIVHASYDLGRAATSIVQGKLFNAGQTCVAVDHAFVPAGKEAAFADAYAAAVAKQYPRLVDNPDYTSIANDRHFARLRALLDDARAKGATIREINPGNEAPRNDRKMLPTVVLGATPDMLLMQDEIFGPILPVLGYVGLDEAIRRVNEGPRPLALYYFDDDGARVNEVLTRTTSGGATVNDTLLHFAQPDLPFGGVGTSGMGASHGFDGFRLFTHEKAVFHQSRLNGVGLMRPPYGKMFDRILKVLGA